MMGGSEIVRRRFRVGLVVLVGMIASGVGIFMVGQRASLFTRKVEYQIRFGSAAGLTAGNAVRLAGVTIGNVTDVALSNKPGDSTVTVLISVDRRMTSRIRIDSLAAIKTIGLLGDKYIEIEGGSEKAVEIPPGGQISAAPEAGFEKLLAGGEGLLGDLTAIARSLKNILGRTEEGKGFLGELTGESEKGKQLGTSLHQVLKQLSATLEKINSGKSLAGRILVDERYGKETGDSLSSALGSVSHLLGKISTSLDKPDGAISALLSDPEGKKKLYGLIDNLSAAGVSLARVSSNLEKGKGTLPLLLNDERFAREFREHLENLTRHLDSVSSKLDSTDGSIGKLIADPALFDAANDIVVGINDSKLLKWLIQNRQKRGIKDRYKKEKAASEPGAPPSR
jgi:phospholipid/cholesterol/gamma-HCH transport system substrate-binding protein